MTLLLDTHALLWFLTNDSNLRAHAARSIASDSPVPIPSLNAEGLLPLGIHDCSLPELRVRFASFQGSDHRARLFTRLEELVGVMQRSGLFEALLIDGSFVTGKPAPNDIDLLAVLRPGHDFERDLPCPNTPWSPAPCCAAGPASTSSLPNETVTCITPTSNSSAVSGNARRRGRDCCE